MQDYEDDDEHINMMLKNMERRHKGVIISTPLAPATTD